MIEKTAVSDHMKRSSLILQEYEKKLHLVQNYETRIKIYDKIKAVGDAEICTLVEELEKLEN